METSAGPLWKCFLISYQRYIYTSQDSTYNTMKSIETPEKEMKTKTLKESKLHLTPHSEILIHSGIRGSLNRDPPCSADTEPLTTRHSRRDDLTLCNTNFQFVCSTYSRLLCLQYNIPSWLVFLWFWQWFSGWWWCVSGWWW